MLNTAASFRHRHLRGNALAWEYTKFPSRIQRLVQGIYQKFLRNSLGYEIGEGAFIATNAGLFADSLSIGAKTVICAGAVLKDDVVIGDGCIIGKNNYIGGDIRIGSNTMFGGDVSVLGWNHGMDIDSPMIHQPQTRKGIVIGDDCWIGASVTIVDGVTIGSHCVIAAGAVVTKNVPSWSVAAGVPATIIKDRRTPKLSVVEGGVVH